MKPNEYIHNHFKRKKYIASGARRDVYDLGKGRVLKIAKSKYGVKSNRTEVKLYKSCRSSVKKYIGTIADYGQGYAWIIMKKYIVDFPMSKRYKRKLSRLKRKFKKLGIYPYEMFSRTGKPNYQNLRLKLNGKIVVIDYGNFVKYKRRESRVSAASFEPASGTGENTGSDED